jgi:hypothetical protein
VPRTEETSDTDDPSPPRRFFFIHVQKTAGTALFQRLRNQFGADGVYPNESDGDLIVVAPQIMVPQLLERWAARRDEIRVVSGHFPLCTVGLLDAPFITLTVLREPVERTLSYLRHHRVLTAEDRDKSLEEIYEDDFRFHGLIHNHMVKMFGMTAEEMDGGVLTHVEFTPEHLARAKDLLPTVDVVGLQEDFDDFCAEIEARYAIDLGDPRFANRTEAVDVTEAFRARIAEDNAMDVEFYEYARALVAQRQAQRRAERTTAR